MRKLIRNLLKPLGIYLDYRKHFDAIPGFTDSYAQDTQKLAVHRVRLIVFIGLVCYSCVGIMDSLLYPNVIGILLSIRVVFALTCLMTLFLSRTDWGKKHILELLFVTAMTGDWGVSMMISQIGGWTSLYFVGNIIMATGVTMFVPWRPRMSFVYSSLALLGYIGFNGLFHPFAIEMIIPVAFMLIILCLTYFSTTSMEISRMSQWASRLEIEKAHEELKQMNDAKVRFFANISHELRTPLTLIISPLTTVARKGGTISQELLDSMVANSQRLLRQVNALLDLGKVDSQEMKCNFEVANVKKLVTELYSAALPGSKERGIKLGLHVLSDIPNSSFDLEKIETIVANLISNGIKFTPAGGSVDIFCEVKGEKLLLSVKDTGAGIPSDQLDKIFSRFHQVNDLNKKASKGTGLGLSVAKEFAELHGGRIWVESTLGSGTQFFVEIPFHRVDQAPGHQEETTSESQIRTDARGTLLVDIVATEGSEYSDKGIGTENSNRMIKRGKTQSVVLYVDDNRDLRHYVDGILGRDYTVLLAQDGEQGLEEALKYSPDLILSDVMMPKMNGFELCRSIRRQPELKSTPFVLLTANATLDSRIEGLEDGADDYLSKPFSEQELVARIKNLVKLREQAKLIKKQINEAKDIQQTLLPPLIQTLNGVVVEAIYEPSEILSGDFFDTVSCGQWVYIYLADVTGHGLPAAQVTYLVKQIFATALTQELDLNRLFHVVREKYLEHQLQYDLGIQMVRVNSKTGEVEYLRSNAPDPVMMSEKKEGRILTTPISPLISALATQKDTDPEISKIKIPAGSTVYLYSDGAYEFNLISGSEFGQRRLVSTLSGSHLEKWPDSLTQQLKTENKDDYFPDDLTIIRIRLDEKNEGRLTGS